MDYTVYLHEWLATFVPVSPIRNEHSVINEIRRLCDDSIQSCLIRALMVRGSNKSLRVCELALEYALTKYNIKNDLALTNAICNSRKG